MKIVVIGGSNIDYISKSYNPLIENDSNPGSINISFGGVSNNIVRNLAYLGKEVTFISAIGNDEYGLKLKKHLKDMNVNLICPESNLASSSYLAIHDFNGEMKLAICNSDITKLINIKFLKENHEIINQSDLLIIDTNLDEETIDYIFKTYSNKKIISDGISVTKCKKLQNYLDKLYLLKVNKLEYDALNINDDNRPQNLIVSNGSKELLFYEKSKMKIFKINKIDNFVNATGAGDALLALTIYGISTNLSFEKAIELGIKAASMTLQVEEAVNEKIGELNLC